MGATLQVQQALAQALAPVLGAPPITYPTDELPRRVPGAVLVLESASHALDAGGRLRTTWEWMLWLGVPVDGHDARRAWDQLADLVDAVLDALHASRYLSDLVLIAGVTQDRVQVITREDGRPAILEARLTVRVQAMRG